MQDASHERLIRLRLATPAPGDFAPAAVYRLAATWLVADRPLPELAPFAVPLLPPGVDAGQPADWRQRAVERLVYRGPGMVAGAMREVECRRVAQGWEVVIPDVARLGVSLDGDEVAVLDAELELAPPVLAEAILGPGLILALAVHGVYCLHASAVRTPHGVIAFLGESGRGKSTLARFLAAAAGLGWTRVADDILPVEPTPEGLDVLPHFPQLKLPDEEQYQRSHPERLALRMACVLAPDQNPTDDAVSLSPLAPLSASLALLRHTAAARLFDRRLAAAHLALCGKAATGTAPSCLAYRFKLSTLPDVASALARDLP